MEINPHSTTTTDTMTINNNTNANTINNPSDLVNAVSKLRSDAINQHQNEVLKELESKYVGHIEGCLAEFTDQYNKLQLSFSSTLNDVSSMVNENAPDSIDDNTKFHQILNRLQSAFQHARSTVKNIKLPQTQSQYQMVECNCIHYIIYIITLCFVSYKN